MVTGEKKPFPCNPDQACLYATFLGLESFSSDYRLQQTLKGIRRLRCPGGRPRHPLSMEDFRAIYLLLNTLVLTDLVFWCAITLFYRALLRKSHYIPSPHTLRWRDISIYPDHLVLILLSSKTDQFSHRPHPYRVECFPGLDSMPCEVAD